MMVLGYAVPGHGQDAYALAIDTISDGGVTVSWTNDAVLQASSNLNSWSNLRAATSPYTNTVESQAEFFRLRRPDFTLFGNHITGSDVSLIDYDQNLVHSWTSDRQRRDSVYLFDDGSIMRAAWLQNPVFTAPGSGGRLEKRDWDSNLLWSFDYSTSTNCHHDDLRT